MANLQTAAPGVLRRLRSDARPVHHRRKPQPHGPFHEEVVDAELALVDARKRIGNQARRRGR